MVVDMSATLTGSGAMSGALDTIDSGVRIVLGGVRRRFTRRPALADMAMVTSGHGSMVAAGVLATAASLSASIHGSGVLNGSAVVTVSDDEECTALALLYLLDLAA